MKKLTLILLPLLLLGAGCATQPTTFLTNDEIIAETKKCEDAGLEAKPLFNCGFYGCSIGIAWIQCEPRTP